MKQNILNVRLLIVIITVVVVGLLLNKYCGQDSSGSLKYVVTLVALALPIAGSLFVDPLFHILYYVGVMPLYHGFGFELALDVVVIVMTLIHGRRVALQWSYSWFGIAFCVMALASQAWAAEPDLTETGFIFLIGPMMLVSIAISLVGVSALYRKAALVMITAAAVGSVKTILTWKSGAVSDYNNQGRFESFIQPDMFAGWVVLASLLVCALLLDEEVDRKSKFYGTLMLPVSIVGMILSGYRGPMLAFVVGILTLVWASRKVIFGVVVGAVVGLVVFITNLLVPELFEKVFTRLATSSEEGGDSGRFEIWENGLKIFKQSPIYGVGWDGFPYWLKKVLGAKVLAHNIYLSAAVELGIIGIALMLVWFGVMAMKSMKSKDRSYRLPALLGFLVQGMVMPQFFIAYFWVTLAFNEKKDRDE